MKKEYLNPTSKVIDFKIEGMIANSLGIYEASGNQQLTNQKDGYEDKSIWQDQGMWK